MECGLSGAAAFKRRLLRSCGWRVVTVSFDESHLESGDAWLLCCFHAGEEYIADALKKMIVSWLSGYAEGTLRPSQM